MAPGTESPVLGTESPVYPSGQCAHLECSAGLLTFRMSCSQQTGVIGVLWEVSKEASLEGSIWRQACGAKNGKLCGSGVSQWPRGKRTCWSPRMHCGVWQSPRGEAAGQTEALVPAPLAQMLPGN